jgi:hypothetical protein
MRQAARRIVAGLALTGALLTSEADAFDPSFQPLDLTVTPIAEFRAGSPETRFGTLEFLGGLQLAADDKRFGSWSGLDVAPDGTLVAVSDRGQWLTGKLNEENGRLAGFRDARIARMLDQNGNAFIGKKNSDAEGLRIVRGKGRDEAYVSFEGINTVRRYAAAPDFAHADARPVKIPLAVGKIRGPDGIEGLAVAPDGSPLGGALVLFAEHSLDASGNHRAWIVNGPRAGAFAIVKIGDFNVADAAFLPGGDLLILERRFSYASGITMRIRRIAGADLRPGAVVDGPVQIEANLLYQIDNMEGLSVRAGADGRTVIDLISDDNGNRMLQRTLLLEFAIADDTPAPPSTTTAAETGGEPSAVKPAGASVEHSATASGAAKAAPLSPAEPPVEQIASPRRLAPPLPRPRPQPAG